MVTEHNNDGSKCVNLFLRADLCLHVCDTFACRLTLFIVAALLDRDNKPSVPSFAEQGCGSSRFYLRVSLGGAANDDVYVHRVAN